MKINEQTDKQRIRIKKREKKKEKNKIEREKRQEVEASELNQDSKLTPKETLR